MNKRNNARISGTGIYLPICKVEQVIAQPIALWRGFLVTEDSTSESERGFIYFTRTYHPDTNEYDKIYPEIPVKDKDIIGLEFLLVPKEKVVFRYQPPTEGGIMLPPSMKQERGHIKI